MTADADSWLQEASKQEAEMTDQAPEVDHVVDYQKLARRDAELVLSIDPARFERLGEATEGLASVAVRLQFERDEQGFCRVRGDAKAELTLACQRCLLPVAQRVEASIDVAVVRGDAAARQFGKRADVFVAGGDTLDVTALVEDDLLLSLPVDRCQRDPCPNEPVLSYPPPGSEAEQDSGQVAAQEQDAEAEASPFAVLEQLKKPK